MEYHGADEHDHDLDIMDGMLSPFNDALSSYLQDLDKQYSKAEGDRKKVMLDYAGKIRDILRRAHVDMPLMHELILRYRAETWSAKEMPAIARLTIAAAMEPRFFDGRGRRDPSFVNELRWEAKRLAEAYPWFINVPERIEMRPTMVPQEGGLEHELSISDPSLPRHEDDATWRRMAQIMMEIDHADPEYMKEVRNIIASMKPVWEKWKSDTPAGVFTIAGDALIAGSDPVVQLLPRWVIDCLIIRYLVSRPPQQLAKIADMAAESKPGHLLPIAEEMATATLGIMRNSMRRGDMPAKRMARIANAYAELGDIGSAMAMYTAAAKGTEEFEPFHADLVLDKAMLMQKNGLDGIAEIDAFIALQEQRHRPGFVAAGMATMVMALKAAEREDDAASLLELTKDFVMAHKDEIGIWQQHARLVMACRAMGDTFLALRLLDVALTSKADTTRKDPVWRSLVDSHVALQATVARQRASKRDQNTRRMNAPHDGRRYYRH